MSASNAERQKKYRDKKRGGAPHGRWPKQHLSAEILAATGGVSRTMIFMMSWVMRHAPEYQLDLAENRVKLTPLYRRLRGEYNLAIAAAVRTATDKQRAQDG
jgi:hypothetical protein